MKQSIPVWTIYAIIVLLILILAAVIVGTVIPRMERSAQVQAETANAVLQANGLATEEAAYKATLAAASPSALELRRTQGAITLTPRP